MTVTQTLWSPPTFPLDLSPVKSHILNTDWLIYLPFIKQRPLGISLSQLHINWSIGQVPAFIYVLLESYMVM